MPTAEEHTPRDTPREGVVAAPGLLLDGPRKKLVIPGLDEPVAVVAGKVKLLGGVLMQLCDATVAKSDNLSRHHKDSTTIVEAVEELVGLAVLTLLPDDYPIPERYQHHRATFPGDCAELAGIVAAAYKSLCEDDLHVPKLAAFTRALKGWVEKIEATYCTQPKNTEKKAPAAQERAADAAQPHAHDDSPAAERGLAREPEDAASPK
eukprot:TRINITY_DN12315_c0_g1_i1.p1 TRINITY_DN12315_c0_g1~~TRINITY_DN12315_c0_g1_i1.p1  ORF type:complete len:207 (+),score=59.79 TRINITY_DN12315_c0_g1_i1:46-666(+)